MRITTIGLMLLLALPAAHAQKLYKWVDAEGRVTYRDQPPADPTVKVEEQNLPFGKKPAAAAPEVSLPPVVLYSAPKCSPCDQAREYLKKRGVPFTEKNAEGSVAVQEELRKRTGTLMVPTVAVGEHVMNGYSESLLAGELDQAGFAKAEGPKEESPPSQ